MHMRYGGPEISKTSDWYILDGIFNSNTGCACGLGIVNVILAVAVAIKLIKSKYKGYIWVIFSYDVFY